MGGGKGGKGKQKHKIRVNLKIMTGMLRVKKGKCKLQKKGNYKAEKGKKSEGGKSKMGFWGGGGWGEWGGRFFEEEGHPILGGAKNTTHREKKKNMGGSFRPMKRFKRPSRRSQNLGGKKRE